MGRRWSQKEESALAEVRRRLKDQLENRPQFPEVVGDRRLIRFIRAKDYNMDVVCRMISNFLKWRDANKVDDIRQDIIYGGKDTPLKFPFGKVIIDIVPQIIISANSVDKQGRPMAMEMFNFDPKDVLAAITVADYLVFLTYALEYRAIVMEQMSHDLEQKYLAAHPNSHDREDGYGVVILDYTIRDLKGVGLAHLGSKGRALVGAALELGLPNYEEYLGKCVMINVPWIITPFWYFVRGFLDEKTILKIDLVGSHFMPTLLEDMTFENIPERFGGGFKLYNEPFKFNTSPGGPLFCGPTEDELSPGTSQKPGQFAAAPLVVDVSSPRGMSGKSGRTGGGGGNNSGGFSQRMSLQDPSFSSNPSSGRSSVASSSSPQRDSTWRSVSSSSNSTSTSNPAPFDRVSSTSSITSSLTDPESPGRSFESASGRAPINNGASRTAASLLFGRVPEDSQRGSAKSSHPPSWGRQLSGIAERPLYDEPDSPMSSVSSQSDCRPSRPEFDLRDTMVHRNSGHKPNSLSLGEMSPLSPVRRNSGTAPGTTTGTGTTGAYLSPSALSKNNSNNTGTTHSSAFSTRSVSFADSCKGPPEPRKSDFILVAIVRAVWAEFCEFLSTIWLLLTQHPVKTVCSAGVVGVFLYLRLQDRLHLMVFPVIALATLLCFEKIH